MQTYILLKAKGTQNTIIHNTQHTHINIDMTSESLTLNGCVRVEVELYSSSRGDGVLASVCVHHQAGAGVDVYRTRGGSIVLGYEKKRDVRCDMRSNYRKEKKVMLV